MKYTYYGNCPVSEFAEQAMREAGRSPEKEYGPKGKTVNGKPSFFISEDGLSITCHLCGQTSYNLEDVKKRYCNYCRVFPEDLGVL